MSAQDSKYHRWVGSRRWALRGLLWTAAGAPLLFMRSRAEGETCESSPGVPIEGPYYFGDVEETYDTGRGVTVRGSVRDATSCAPIENATIVRWHSNPSGIYEDFFRARMTAGAGGAYEMSTSGPGIYAGLSRHIHFHVSAPGYRDLITQIQWDNAEEPPPDNTFDFALEPA